MIEYDHSLDRKQNKWHLWRTAIVVGVPVVVVVELILTFMASNP